MDAVEVASSAKTEVGRDQANRQADLLLIKLRRMVNGDGNGDAEESAFASIVNYQIVSDRCEILRQAVSQEFFACLKQQAAAHDKAMKSIGLANYQTKNSIPLKSRPSAAFLLPEARNTGSGRASPKSSSMCPRACR